MACKSCGGSVQTKTTVHRMTNTIPRPLLKVKRVESLGSRKLTAKPIAIKPANNLDRHRA